MKAGDAFALGVLTGILTALVFAPGAALLAMRHVKPLRDHVRWSAERGIEVKVNSVLANLQSPRNTSVTTRAAVQAALPILVVATGKSTAAFIHEDVSGPAVGAVFEAFGIPNP